MLSSSIKRNLVAGTFNNLSVTKRGVAISTSRSPIKFSTTDAPAWLAEMARKGAKKTNKIRLGDLKGVLMKVEAAPEHLNCAFEGVAIIQDRGDDFSRELCTIFVRVCVKHGAAKQAAEILTKRNHRLSAWMCYKPYVSIMNALSASGEVRQMVDMTKTLISKNAHIQPEFVGESLIKSASTAGDARLYEEAVKTASKVLPQPDIANLQNTYKFVGAESAAATA